MVNLLRNCWWVWGSEKGAYLEFYADMFEEDFTRIDEIVLNWTQKS